MFNSYVTNYQMLIHDVPGDFKMMSLGEISSPRDRAQLTSLVTSHWKCYVYIINVHDHLFLASCSLWLYHFYIHIYIYTFFKVVIIYIYIYVVRIFHFHGQILTSKHWWAHRGFVSPLLSGKAYYEMLRGRPNAIKLPFGNVIDIPIGVPKYQLQVMMLVEQCHKPLKFGNI